jgi:hypothetical protein
VVIFSHSYGTFTIDDIREVAQDVENRVAVGTPFMHTILDNTHVERMDFGINDLKALIFHELKSSPDVAWSLQITPSKIDRFFASVASQFTNLRNRQFDTVEDALAFLAENDDTLPSYDEMLAAYHALKSELALPQPE